MVSVNELVSWLRLLDQRAGNSFLPIIRVESGDPLLDWPGLGPCTDCGYPGIGVGQTSDCRYPTDGVEGLHAQTMSGGKFVDFHLDRRDACRDAIGHNIHDTGMVAGAVGGFLVGWSTGAVLERKFSMNNIGPWTSLLGVIGGAVYGAYTPRAERRSVAFRDLARIMGALPPPIQIRRRCPCP